ncbi:hypothetical protein HZ326_31790, partial [Fusarium oxysporum f. sp. albedinis]
MTSCPQKFPLSLSNHYLHMLGGPCRR